MLISRFNSCCRLWLLASSTPRGLSSVGPVAQIWIGANNIGVDAESGLVHTVIGTAANVNDVTQGHALLHGEEQVVFADAGYQGASKRPDATGVDWHVAMRPGKRRAQKHTPWGALHKQVEQFKASVRAKVEHPFRAIKRQFGYVKVRYRGLAKNTAQLITLFALSNIWMARSRLMQRAQG
jgi:IS5 family transposase